MFQICVLAIAGVLASLIVKRDKPEYAALIIMLISFYIALRVMAMLGNLLEEVRSWQALIGDNSVYVSLLLKLIGITYLCEFAANLCRDSGYNALSGHIELFGKVAVMAAGFPVVKIMVEMLEGIMG
jgi:stage III sporulation protein AD